MDSSVYGTLTSITKDGKDFKTHARGIRNSVGLDFHPTTGNVWFTDNSPNIDDDFGDERPGNELNELVSTTRTPHFGFPYCYEKTLPDPDFNVNKTCDAYVPAKYVLEAHVAALGMDFYQAGTRNPNVPKDWKGDNIVLIAEHGSLNRTVNHGYRVSMVNLTIPTHEAYTTFIDGWMDNPKEPSRPWGRPVDILVLSDGSFLVSDDRAGVIYRVYYFVAPSIKLWAYIAFPLLFLFALSAVGAGVFFFNKYQTAKNPPQEEEFQQMEEEQELE
jgi:glucose/arabinose dehydrogenase